MDKRFCPYCMTPVNEGESCPTCGLTAGNYTPSPHHLPPGTVLMDRYLVGRVLGEGGFGITYIGCDLRLELKVAIKEYFPSDKVTRHAQASLDVTNYTGLAAASFEAGKSRFLKEARTMARMDKQPNIVSVRDFFEVNNTAYIVMEYVEGTTFKELVAQKGGRIAAGELLYMIEPLFSALSTMHAAGLIHRDISPDNLMLENGHVRLIDFGCARESTHGTETMTIALKQGYAPMEQYQQKGQGPWTDVYALSATIYYCLTGKAPPQALDRLCDDELILPRKLGVDLTEKQEKALLYGMGIRPRRRFQSVDELHAALYENSITPPAPEPFLRNDLIPTPEPPKPEPPMQEPPKPEPPKPEPPMPEPPKPEPPKPEPPKSEPQTPQTVVRTGEPSQPASGAPAWKKPALWAGVGAAAVLLIVLLAVFLSRGKGPAVDDPDGTESVPPSETVTQPVETDPFADAARLSEGAGEDDLRALLENDGVPAVILPSGCGITLTNGSLEIAKPLFIEEGAGLSSSLPITVSGEGDLRIEGSFASDMLRTTGGGSISVGATGNLGGLGLVWIERAADLTVEPGGAVNIYGKNYGSDGSGDRYLVLCEEELFADAVHVNSIAQLNAAVADPNVTAIVIDGSLILSEPLVHSVPVLISEGVTVRGQHRTWEWNGSSRIWMVDSTILINHGTLACDVNAGEFERYNNGTDLCTIINYGEMSGSMFLDCGGSLINYGDITIAAAQVLQTNLYNLGTLTHQGTNDSNFLNIYCPTVCNFGELVETGSYRGYTNLTHGVTFNNTGTIRVENGGNLENQSTLDNMGLIRVDAGGNLGNMGYLIAENGNAGLDLDPDSTLGYNGLYQLPYGETLGLPNNVDDGGGSTACFIWGRGDAYDVRTEDELRRGLNGELSDLPLCMNSADIAVNGDLTVGRTLAISADYTLTVTGGNLTVTGRDTFLFCHGVIDLGGGALTLTDGAVLVGRIVNCSGITIEEGAKLVTKDGLDVLPSSVTGGTQITLNGGHLINMCAATLDDVSIRIGEGVLRTLGGLEVVNSGVVVDDGELLANNSDIALYNTVLTITERGDFAAGANHGGFTCTLWSVENHGWMEVGMPMQFGTSGTGSSTNYGTIQFWSDLTVAGSLKNEGTMLAVSGAEVRTENRGTFTGTEPESRSEYVDKNAIGS